MTANDTKGALPSPYEVARQRLLHLADVVRKAPDAATLRAMLLMDTAWSGHSYDTLRLLDNVANVGDDLATCMGADLDEDGVPA